MGPKAAKSRVRSGREGNIFQMVGMKPPVEGSGSDPLDGMEQSYGVGESMVTNRQAVAFETRRFMAI